MEGWIRIYRQIRNSWIWKDKEPFDKRSAWIDLLLSANYKNKKIPFENTFIEIERGQMLTSIKQLAERWKWSRHKVSDYVNMLEKDTMIVQIRDKRKILISIVNYDKYQPMLEERDILSDTSRDILSDILGTQTIMIIIIYIYFYLINIKGNFRF